MQKIIEQELGGDKEKAKDIVKYTWAKDEIAFYFCPTFNDVFKIQFTGERWFLLSRWSKGDKIYQYKYLESSGRDITYAGEKGISHGNENVFYTTKEEAIERGIRYTEYQLNEAIDKHKSDLARLMTYAGDLKLKPCILS